MSKDWNPPQRIWISKTVDATVEGVWSDNPTWGFNGNPSYVLETSYSHVVLERDFYKSSSALLDSENALLREENERLRAFILSMAEKIKSACDEVIKEYDKND